MLHKKVICDIKLPFYLYANGFPPTIYLHNVCEGLCRHEGGVSCNLIRLAAYLLFPDSPLSKQPLFLSMTSHQRSVFSRGLERSSRKVFPLLRNMFVFPLRGGICLVYSVSPVKLPSCCQTKGGRHKPLLCCHPAVLNHSERTALNSSQSL